MEGSSPLARGTRNLHPGDGPVCGLIPARAGNTTARYVQRRGVQAHPRSRGEHMMGSSNESVASGSSPLARGTQAHRRGLVRLRGLIPARAGNTCGGFPLFHAPRAHPRSRGEHAVVINALMMLLGSSPLARGTPDAVAYAVGRTRLIPARAGNTSTTASMSPNTVAHPRSRGEHL